MFVRTARDFVDFRFPRGKRRFQQRPIEEETKLPGGVGGSDQVWKRGMNELEDAGQGEKGRIFGVGGSGNGEKSVENGVELAGFGLWVGLGDGEGHQQTRCGNGINEGIGFLSAE